MRGGRKNNDFLEEKGFETRDFIEN